jgi:hypothetical protein
MPRILRVNDPNGDPIGTADSQEGITCVIEGLGPGRYHVDEMSADPLPSGPPRDDGESVLSALMVR